MAKKKSSNTTYEFVCEAHDDNAETDEFGNKDFYGYDFIMDMLQELLNANNE